MRFAQNGGADALKHQGDIIFLKGQRDDDVQRYADDRIAEARKVRGTKKKIRHDAVKLVELCISVSANTVKTNHLFEVEGFMARSYSWLEETFGEKNIAAAVCHLDESAPHVHALIVPITDDNRLCAKEIFSPSQLIRYQDSIAEKLAIFGLDRGTRGSKSRHRSLKAYNGEIDKMVSEAELTKPFSANMSAMVYYQAANSEFKKIVGLCAEKLQTAEKEIETLQSEVRELRKKVGILDRLKMFCPTFVRRLIDGITGRESADLREMEYKFRTYEAEREKHSGFER